MFPAETTGLDWPLNFLVCAFTFLDNITLATALFLTMNVVIPLSVLELSFFFLAFFSGFLPSHLNKLISVKKSIYMFKHQKCPFLSQLRSYLMFTSVI